MRDDARRPPAARVLTPALRRWLDSQPVGVLAVLAADGQPRQSLVYFTREGDRLLVSALADRLEAPAARRVARASLCVVGRHPPFPWAAFSGPAKVLTRDIGAATAAIARRITGAAEPPAPATDEALARVGRVILAIAVDKVSADSYLPPAPG
jgi:Pyridoxamine 5'-phosphate oxidase